MKIPPIDLSKLVGNFKKEGKGELFSDLKNNPFGANSEIIKQWDEIIGVLENDLIPQLAKGGELSHLMPSVKALKASVASLALMATQVLSFVPGPIGIISSIINAIACFSSSNVLGGIFELLGCIPGAKFAIKGGGKFFTKIGDEVYDILKNNKELAKHLEDWEKLMDKTETFTRELNFLKIKKLTEKLQKDINNIKHNVSQQKRKLDTGPTYSMNLENSLMNNRGIEKSNVWQRTNNGKQLQNRGISENRIRDGLSPQMKIKLWE